MHRRFLLFVLIAACAGAATAQRRTAEVVLEGVPLARKVDRAHLFTPESDAYRAALRQGKATLAARAAQRGIEVKWQLETLLNAMIVEAASDDLVWLRAQPGVVSAEFSRPMHLHMDAATALIGATKVWTSLGGADQAGRGIKIGILDSGIDITNPMFSASGFSYPAGFPQGNTAFVNAKVIVARNFTSDPTPADGFGHGTFVASVAAGRTTVTDLDTTISGVAPGAYLGAYKTATATGVGNSGALMAAINQAVQDHMDILSYSGGTEPGARIANDPLATVIGNAITAGVVFVISVGNCGPSGEAAPACASDGDFTIASPGAEPGVISVGASTNSHVLERLMHITSSATVPASLQSLPFAAGSDPVFPATLGPASMVDITQYDSTSLGCGSYPAASLTGKIAVVLRGTCVVTQKLAAVAAAGGIGVIMYDSSVEALPGIQTTGAAVPLAVITSADGATLLTFLAARADAKVQLIGAQVFVTQGTVADQIAGYSGRGPSPDYGIKPDLVAPGNVYAAAVTLSTATIKSATGFTLQAGTSFATPMTAGAAAVIKGARPTLSVADIKSVLANTGSPITSTQDGAPAGVMSQGGGRLNLPNAMAATLTANPVSLSAGLITGTSISQSITTTLKNVGGASEVFSVAVAPITADPALQVTVDSASLPLAAGQTRTLTLQFTSASALHGVFEGYVMIQSQSTATLLRIPYWVMFGTPAISAGSLVDGAGYGANVAPGSIVSLFGSNLGGNAAVATTVPLPTDVAHTVVSFVPAGAPTPVNAPIFFSASSQVNLQLPFTLPAGVATKMTAVVAGQSSSVVTITPVAAAPGIFTTTSDGKGSAIVLHGDYSLVTAANPAKAGEYVAIYCTGLGAVNQAVASGAASPSAVPALTTATPTVTIGGKNAPVVFSGLAPLFVGLYQVNVQIPSGLGTGAPSLSLSISGGAANPTTIPVQN